MAGGLTTKVRVVRCPKCLLFLPELPNLPIYRCGGCGAILQAKSQKNGTTSPGSVIDDKDKDSNQGSEHDDRVSEDKASCSSHDNVILSSSGESSPDQKTGTDQSESPECNHEQQLEGLKSSERENNGCDKDETAHLKKEEKSEVEINEEILPSKGLNSEAEVNNEIQLNVRSSNAVEQTEVDDTLLEQPQVNVAIGIKQGSRDAFEGTKSIDPNSEMSPTGHVGALGMFKSPTTRSSFAYDGSVSSFDGSEDQVPDIHLHSLKKNHNVPKYVTSEKMVKRDSVMSREGTMDSWSNFADQKRYAMKDQDEMMAPTRHGNPVWNRSRVERDEYPSRERPLYSSDSIGGYDSGGTSNPVYNNNFHYDSSFSSSYKEPIGPDHEKQKLLRMVNELQDQLNKTCIPNRRVSSGLTEEELWHDLDYHKFHSRYKPNSNWGPPRQMTGIPFSAESTRSQRRPVDRFYVSYYSQRRQRSMQLPPPGPWPKKELYREQASHTYNSYNSCPPSPQHLSKFDCHIRSHDYIQLKKMNSREKHHSVKRHFRPLAGGSPIIACDNCWKLLQLPADFLLFKRRWHRLKCGGCSEVLKFSLQKGNHLVLVHCVEGDTDPPPSGVYDCGMSISKSFSTDGEPGLHAPFSSPRGKGASGSSLVIEDVPVRSTSPLHRLMGYSSPSEVMYGTSMTS